MQEFIIVNASSKNGALDTFANYEIILFKLKNGFSMNFKF